MLTVLPITAHTGRGCAAQPADVAADVLRRGGHPEPHPVAGRPHGRAPALQDTRQCRPALHARPRYGCCSNHVPCLTFDMFNFPHRTLSVEPAGSMPPIMPPFMCHSPSRSDHAVAGLTAGVEAPVTLFGAIHPRIVTTGQPHRRLGKSRLGRAAEAAPPPVTRQTRGHPDRAVSGELRREKSTDHSACALEVCIQSLKAAVAVGCSCSESPCFSSRQSTPPTACGVRACSGVLSCQPIK